MVVKLQCKKRWLADSSTIPQKTHLEDTSGDKQLRLARFLLVGILSIRSFQEKATTYKGALLFQIVSKTFNSSILHSTSLPNKGMDHIEIGKQYIQKL